MLYFLINGISEMTKNRYRVLALCIKFILNIDFVSKNKFQVSLYYVFILSIVQKKLVYLTVLLNRFSSDEWISIKTSIEFITRIMKLLRFLRLRSVF